MEKVSEWRSYLSFSISVSVLPCYEHTNCHTDTHTAINHVNVSFSNAFPDYSSAILNKDNCVKQLKIWIIMHCTVTILDNTIMMYSRAEKDTPRRHGTFQNGTARVSTHDSTKDVCAGLTRPYRLVTVRFLPYTNHYACLTITPNTLPSFSYVLYLCLYV